MTQSVALSSEIAELESILRSIPEDAVIERSTFEKRLKSARSALDALPPAAAKEKLKLVFRGKPVDGSHGIVANFAAKATKNFADAFNAVSAGMSETLKYMGPIPGRKNAPLMITGTAIGSFGFEFEIPSEGSANVEGLPERAARNIQRLFQVAAEGNDEDIAELVQVIHPRAVRKVSSFLAHLAKNEAWCGLEFEGSYFRYKNVAQLRSSAERLVDANIRESTDLLFGQLKGVLPQSRTFEFKPDSGPMIRGRVGPTIEDAEALNLQWLNKDIAGRFNIIQVGKATPRFTLIEIVRGQSTSSSP